MSFRKAFIKKIKMYESDIFEFYAFEVINS